MAAKALAALSDTGLTLRGSVQYRKRRKFEKKGGGGFRFNIELGVLTKDGLIRAERWADTPKPEDTPDQGTDVELPVVLQFYQGKSGGGARLIWGASQDSESF